MEKKGFRSKLFILPIMVSLLASCDGGFLSMSSESSTDSVSLSDSESSSLETSSTIDSSSTSESTYPDDAYFSETYKNIIYPTQQSGTGKYSGEIADPHVIAGDDGFYYIFSTGRKAFRSQDMVNWQLYSNAIINRPTWDDANSGGNPEVWAPDIAHIDGKWIYYYSLSVWGGEWSAGIGYAVADEIAGPYVDKGKLFTSQEIGLQNSIDPAPFVDDDGSVYLVFGSFSGIGMVQLNDNGQGLLDDDIDYAAKNMKIIVGTKGNSITEGSYIIKKGSDYWYFGSAGSCCSGANSTYRVVAGKANNVFGPYYDANNKVVGTANGSVVVWGGANKDGNVIGPGHNSIFLDDKNQYWMIYHGYAADDNYVTRHLLMDKINWGDNGFPYVETSEGKLRPSYNEELDGPTLLYEEYRDY